MSNMPKEWRSVRLEEVCEINPRDPGPADSSQLVSFVPMPAVSDESGEIIEHQARPFKEVAKGYTRFREGDVIFAKITPCMENGKIAVANGLYNQLACGSTEFHVLRSRGEVLPEYIWRYLRQKSFREEAEGHMTGAVGQRRVPAQYLKEALIPLPPLDEQRRIVARLDALLARSKRARAELTRVPELAERQKRAVLEQAFLGELTREWRASEGLPEPETTTLGAVASDFSYGSAAKSQEAGLVPVLRMGNIQDGRLDWENLVFTSDRAEIAKYRLESGDVLFNRTNSPELVGKTALYQGEREAIYAGYLIRIKCTPNLFPKFLTYCLNSPMGRDYCWQVKTDGVSQSNINSKKLAAFSFNLPSLKEQHEVVRRIEAAFARVDCTAAEVERAAILVERLDQATLARAFRGEL